MSLEAVFALLAGMLILQETITLLQSFGMLFILGSIIAVNIPWDKVSLKIQK
jgi:drug/metabolite transporter (DMT)-like permease